MKNSASCSWLVGRIVTVLLCHFVTVLLCYCITLLLCYCVTLLFVTVLLFTVLLCYCVTLLLCYLLLCYCLLCYFVTVLLCYCVTYWPLESANKNFFRGSSLCVMGSVPVWSVYRWNFCTVGCLNKQASLSFLHGALAVYSAGRKSDHHVLFKAFPVQQFPSRALYPVLLPSNIHPRSDTLPAVLLVTAVQNGNFTSRSFCSRTRQCTVMRRLTTGVHYEKCIVKRVRGRVNVKQCTYTNLDSIYSLLHT
jgi:hypothetical protein